MPEADRAEARAGVGPGAPPRELLPCDLVLKGGITSGVVYPKLIGRLALDYQFKGIGGTSAGAIAAAACAAAELGRQSGTNPEAFAHLSGLPEELKKECGRPPASKLFHLFQPAPSLRSHFAVLEGALNAESAWAAVGGALRSLLAQYWNLALLAGGGALAVLTPMVMGTAGWPPWPAFVGAVALLAGWLAALALAARRPKRLRPPWLLLLAVTLATLFAARLLAVPWSRAALLALACAVAVPLAIALGLGLVAWRFGQTLLRGLHANGYGLCSGATEDSRPKAPGLTDWLSAYLDTLAGRSPGDRPLTFGDLWGAPPDEGKLAETRDTPVADRLVNLEMVTTAISQQMCYSIPFREGLGAFYYEPGEWARLFPPRIMSWLGRVSAAQEQGASFRTAAGAELRRLPSNDSLPVVVGVRMSLSFPVLLSAVPLHARDFSDLENPERGMKRVWFSDGGISSNLPLHFFDAPLPGRPTFAVNLKGEHPAHPVGATDACAPENGRVYLPTTNRAGRIRYWTPPSDETPLGIVSFLWDIVYTMQTWRDEIQFTQPGYRDRIVQISQLPDEGGLNLKMPERIVDALSEAGECAGERLVQRFHPGSVAPERGGWDNHEQVRLRTFVNAVGEMVSHPRVADPHWDTVVERCRDRGLYNKAEADLAHDMLRSLRELGVLVKGSPASLATDAPKPQPTLRIAPRI